VRPRSFFFRGNWLRSESTGGLSLFDLTTLLQEAGRRHVARVAVVYAAVAFAILEAADIIIPALGLPDWTIRWVIALALIGFPVTLILAWIYDVTPRGVVKTGALEDGDPPHGKKGQDRPLVSAALLLFSGAMVAMAAFFAFEWSVSTGPASGGNGAATAPALNPRRVAVLPFVDLDGTDESGFLANGIHDDVLNHLAKIDSLEVISRTTVLQYRDTDKTAGTIGAELGAGSILEGSVRRIGDRIRVVAQLIDASTDNHIWSDSFDRDEGDILRVQSEIAQEIARALQVELTSADLEELEVGVTVSGPAYNRYAQGITQWDLRENRVSAFRATQLFQEATELAPEFAQAHAALAQARMWLFWNFPGFQDQAELAAMALDRAIELAPNAVETLLAQGFFFFYGRGDSEEALRYFRQAEALKPSDANVISAVGLILRGQGRWDEALAEFRRARELDLRSYNLNYILADTYFRMRRFDEAESAFELAATLAPEVPAVHRDLLRARLARTMDTVAARAYVDSLPRSVSPLVRSMLNAELAYYRGDLRGVLERGAESNGRPVPVAGDAAADDLESPPQSRRPGWSHERLALLYHLMGEEELRDAHADSLLLEGQTVLREADEGTPGPVQTGVIARAKAKLGIAYALKGEILPAWREATGAVATLPITADAYEGANHLRDLIITLTLIGEMDLAVQNLETALQVPSTLSLADLALDPIFAPLREEDRVRTLLQSLQ